MMISWPDSKDRAVLSSLLIKVGLLVTPVLVFTDVLKVMLSSIPPICVVDG